MYIVIAMRTTTLWVFNAPRRHIEFNCSKDEATNLNSW